MFITQETDTFVFISYPSVNVDCSLFKTTHFLNISVNEFKKSFYLKNLDLSNMPETMERIHLIVVDLLYFLDKDIPKQLLSYINSFNYNYSFDIYILQYYSFLYKEHHEKYGDKNTFSLAVDNLIISCNQNECEIMYKNRSEKTFPISLEGLNKKTIYYFLMKELYRYITNQSFNLTPNQELFISVMEQSIPIDALNN